VREVRYLAKRQDNGKAPKPRSVTRTKRDGTTYKVTLLGDYHSYRSPWFPTWYRPPRKITAPRLIQGWLMPVQVKVEGLEDVLVLTVDAVRQGPTRGRFYCTKVEVLPVKEGGEVVGVPLTLDTYVRDAVELAALQCVAYPPNYEGPVFSTSSLDAHVTGAALKVGPNEVHVEAVGWLDKVSPRLVREVTSFGSPKRRTEDTKEKLDLVAKTWLNAARKGLKVEEAVHHALNESGEWCSRYNARRLIKKVKDLGLIPRTIGEVRK